MDTLSSDLKVKVKPKDKGLDTCYRATYVSQIRDQQHFTISEVADDWHEPMVPQRIMWLSIARANGHTRSLHRSLPIEAL